MTTAALPNDITIGSIIMGSRKGQALTLDLAEAKRHVLCLGSSGSGKTWVIKVLAEGLLARGIPVIAIDAMGDLTGLALPAGSRQDYEKLGLRPPAPNPSPSDWEVGSNIADVLRTIVHPRVLTPCSRAGEQVAIMPLTSRPKAWDRLWQTDREDLVLQADAQAANFLGRIGFKINRSAGSAPSHELGVATDVLLRCWQEDMDLSGPGGFEAFGNALVESKQPSLCKEAADKIRKNLSALAMGAQALWFEGASFDLDRLLTAPPGKVPFISVSIAHLPHQDRPWVIGQIAHLCANWCAAQGSSPERPRLALIVDELSGDGGANVILPPGTVRNHPSGDALKRILRQGRHYGLTLIGGSQSAGDIDYKSFSNFNTRIIGRLATRPDIEKCIYGLPYDDGGSKKIVDFIAGTRPGNLFVIPPNGQWECGRMRMLGCAHATITKDDLGRLYEQGFLRRRTPPAAPPPPPIAATPAEQLARDIDQLCNRFRERVPQILLDRLEAIRVAALVPPNIDDDAEDPAEPLVDVA